MIGKWNDVSRWVEEHEGTLFLMTFKEANQEQQVFHVIVPREQHSEPSSIQAKENELQHFENYDVYEVVDKPDNVKLIGTQWVIIDKEIPGQTERIRKGRLCLRGDQELDIQSIVRDSRMINKINIKLMIPEAIRKEWEINSSDVTRAFLQTS